MGFRTFLYFLRFTVNVCSRLHRHLEGLVLWHWDKETTVTRSIQHPGCEVDRRLNQNELESARVKQRALQ